jgi:hypothetical protein
MHGRNEVMSDEDGAWISGHEQPSDEPDDQAEDK